MSEARNAIIVTLILLFILIGTGVAISRIVNREDTGETQTAEPSLIERIFSRDEEPEDTDVADADADGDSMLTPADGTLTQETDENGMVIITEDSEDVVVYDKTQPSTQLTNEKNLTTKSGTPQTKGSTPQTDAIPATGTPAAVLFVSLGSLASGLFLRKRS